jgi:hypothetical protein
LVDRRKAYGGRLPLAGASRRWPPQMRDPSAVEIEGDG